MNKNHSITDWNKLSVYMVGIKGVGMTALAEILLSKGAVVAGSDTQEKFFTDTILKALAIPVAEGFRPENLPPDAKLVIYSAAYFPDRHPEILAAKKHRIPCLSYPAALGMLSRQAVSAAVSGVHGKTTTAALVGILVKELGLPATVLAGTQVPGFGNRATYSGGDRYFIAETCEYKRHFLFFSPALLVLTSIEEDHQDYYKNLADMYEAFLEFALSLATGGRLIYCADDPGVAHVIERCQRQRTDIDYIPYGFTASGPYKIVQADLGEGESTFSLAGFTGVFRLHVPGRHTLQNAAAALALGFTLLGDEKRPITADVCGAAVKALADFTGTRRRSEIIGESRGILFMDDYAHHPTAVRTTLAGIREYYPGRRLVVDFMSHTYSRTRALLKQFAESFAQADEVIIHKIYASAREENDGSVSGKSLFTEMKKQRGNIFYFEEVMDAFGFLQNELGPGDLFITMGAGDNWKLSHELFRYFSGT